MAYRESSQHFCAHGRFSSNGIKTILYNILRGKTNRKSTMTTHAKAVFVFLHHRRRIAIKKHKLISSVLRMHWFHIRKLPTEGTLWATHA